MPSQDQINELNKQLVLSGIKEWHDKGYKGISPRTKKAQVFWNTENKGGDGHGESCSKRVWDANPTAVIHHAPMSGSCPSYIVEYNNKKYKVEDFIKEYKIKFIIRSIGGKATVGTKESKFWNDLKKKYNLIFFNSAGNDGLDDDGNSLDCAFPADVAHYTGGINSKFVRVNYSSIGEYLDFMNFMSYLNGTSFASPYTAGEGSLITARYDDDMTDEELFKFFVMICKDLEKTGWDNNTGHGVPILTNCKFYMTMSIGNTNMLIDGVPTTGVAPELIEGITFVPVRIISESLGFKCSYDTNEDKTLKIKVTDGKTTIEMNTESRIYFVNGTQNYFDVAPYIKSGRTMLPFRDIAELFGCKIGWLPEQKKIMLMKVA